MADLARLGGKRFLVIGRAGMDFYADPPGSRVETAHRFTASLGGSAANIAVALVRQGCSAALITRLSDDAVGRFCRNELLAYGVECGHVGIEAGSVRSSLAVVETRLNDTQSVIYRNGASDFELRVEHVQDVDYAAHSALIVTGTALAAEPSRGATLMACDLAQAAGLPVIFDIDYRPYSWSSPQEATAVYSLMAGLCDVVIGNDVEFGFLAGDPRQGLDCARGLVRKGAAIAVYKMGEKGAVTVSPEGEFASGIYRSEALKPTGAGDSFMGAFVAALADGALLGQAVLRGSAAAAMVVARVGCAPAMPDAAELAAFMAAQPAPVLLQPADPPA